MESKIVKKLNPSFETVVLLRSDQKPDNATQASKDRYYCVMSLFAQAVTRGKTVAFDRETYGCPGACAGLGFGTAYDKAMGGFETFASFFSKGLADADDKEAYKAMAEKMNPHVRNLRPSLEAFPGPGKRSGPGHLQISPVDRSAIKHRPWGRWGSSVANPGGNAVNIAHETFIC